MGPYMNDAVAFALFCFSVLSRLISSNAGFHDLCCSFQL